MAKKRNGSVTPESAFLSGTARPRASAQSKGRRQADAPDASPEEAFMKGASDPSKAPQPRAPKAKVPRVRRPAKKAVREWGCTKCGYSVSGNIILPLCPMCEAKDFVEG